MVASEITLAVGDGARSISDLRAALVFILALPAVSAQAGQVPREPYSCRLYVYAGGHCALLNCSDRGNDRRLHLLKRECLRDGGCLPRLSLGAEAPEDTFLTLKSWHVVWHRDCAIAISHTR
jgi:hypothetical protein